VHFSGEFDDVFDVVVIGKGDAGATAAITAHDDGSDVVILEKQDSGDFRPNSRYAAGFMAVPNDVNGAIEYLTALYAVNGEIDEVDVQLLRVWAEETGRNPEWIATVLGGSTTAIARGGEHRTLAGWESLDSHRIVVDVPPDTIGSPLTARLAQAVEERRITCRYNARATRLLTDDDLRVVGVQARVNGQTRTIGAARGVVLASGGFEGNPTLQRQFLPMHPAYFYGSERNTGDGIAMAAEVGAELWHMNVWPGHLVGHFDDAGYSGGFLLDFWGSGRWAPAADVAPPGLMFVDRSGHRFTAEPGRQHALHLELAEVRTATLQTPRIPCWWIFDERRFALGQLPSSYAGPSGPLADYVWSSDNTRELERGWIRTGRTAQDLAEQCGFDPAAFSDTIETFNSACREGTDAAFGRDPSTMTELSGTLYAVTLWPGGSHTPGGPRRDSRARVVSVHGGTVPGLFSAGELGSMFGLLYPAGGASTAESLAFGRIAGHEAAARRS
jgi:succinate dehydrogenase/fumarate reductase flavoprotein subunit